MGFIINFIVGFIGENLLRKIPLMFFSLIFTPPILLLSLIQKGKYIDNVKYYYRVLYKFFVVKDKLK